MKQGQDKQGTPLRENLYESLSALMDGEADELELHRLLKQTEDAALRSQWTRWQVARAALHRETQCLPLGEGFAARVAAALQEAPPAAAPRPARLRTRPRWFGVFGQMAVAASVAALVLGGVRLYQNTPTAAGQPALAQQRAASQPAGFALPLGEMPQLAGYGSPASTQQGAAYAAAGIGVTDWQGKRLASYLRQHSRQGTLQGIDGLLPYARAASFGGQ